MYGHVYKIVNSVNGKVYVGKTKSKYRFSSHLSKIRAGLKTLLGNAVRKYGEDKFRYEIIEYAKTSEELNKLEIFYIKKLKSFCKDGGYNFTMGGDGGIGRIYSQETLNKIRINSTGRIVSEETRKKISIGNKGKKKTDEQIKKATETRMIKGSYISSSETKIKQSLSMKGRVPTLKHRENISKANKGKKRTNDIREKMSKRMTGCIKEYARIVVISKDIKTGEEVEYSSITQASLLTNTLNSSISNCLKGRSKKSGGKFWRYKNKFAH